jgi:23S rRNA A1618 N6-methylase RlmF
MSAELDEDSLKCATENVERNGLTGRVQIVQAVHDGPILPSLLKDFEHTFDFTMCNPPFYSSAEDVTRSAENKEFEPNAVRSLELFN